jgi:alanyl-tRNA synthetase
LSPKLVKDLILGIGKGENDLFILITSVYKTKPYINCYISKNLVVKKSISASQIIKKISYLIEGGGGGQDFYASAGGKKTENLSKILIEVKKMVVNFK